MESPPVNNVIDDNVTTTLVSKHNQNVENLKRPGRGVQGPGAGDVLGGALLSAGGGRATRGRWRGRRGRATGAAETGYTTWARPLRRAGTRAKWKS